jgi:ABC-type lipoprotein export system ATPase subunit
MLAQLDNVCKTYPHADGHVVALHDVSLQLDPGDFLAVCGKSGCGKTTLLLTIGGLLRPDSGTITVRDTDLYRLLPNQRAQFRAQHIGFVFQQFHLVPYLSVMDNVLAATLGLNRRIDTGIRHQASELLDRLGLGSRRRHLPGQLSTGERQRTALARALLNAPSLLLADEPTGNLDPENGAVVLNHLADFAARGGAVLLVTHETAAAERANRMIRLAAGREMPT